MPLERPRGGVAGSGAGRSPVLFLPTPASRKARGVRVRGGEQEQVQRMVAALLSLAEPPEPDHAADALAVAIYHANGAPVREAIAA